MNIPFFNYPAVYLKYKNDFQKALDDVGSRGAFIMQDDLLQFEKKVAKYSNCNFAVGVGNATDALEMLICLSDINKNGNCRNDSNRNSFCNFLISRGVIF